jgi:hypothetical protein
MAAQRSNQQTEKTIMIQKYINLTPDEWKIIFSIFSYMNANRQSFPEYSSLKNDIKSEIRVLEYEIKSVRLSKSLFLKIYNVAQKILGEEWNEYSTITPFSYEELSNLFIKKMMTEWYGVNKEHIMKIRKYGHGLHNNYEDFFNLDGNVNMKLTTHAAIDVCMHAAEKGLVIWRIEGGIWHEANPNLGITAGMEVRFDCIWDSQSKGENNEEEAHKNNLRAVEFIDEEKTIHNAYMITIRKITPPEKYDLHATIIHIKKDN